MEKDEFLDIADKKITSNSNDSNKSQVTSNELKTNDKGLSLSPDPLLVTRYSLLVTDKVTRYSLRSLFLSLLFALLVTGCALPRIVVLDDPLSAEEHVNLGVAYERKGELADAVEEYKKASKNLPRAYLYMGNAYMQMSKPEEAEKSYKKVIKKGPDDPGSADAYNNLAWLYYTRGENLAEAENLALKALRLAPAKENYLDTLQKIRELKAKNGL